MKTYRTILSEIFKTAWSFVKRNGYTMSEALRVAWRNYKLVAQMRVNIVRFTYRKVDGTVREAFGTLDARRYHYEGKGYDRPAPSDCTRYWDTVKGGWRMFKTYNLLSVAN